MRLSERGDKTVRQAAQDEVLCNRQRLHAALGYVTLAEAEQAVGAS